MVEGSGALIFGNGKTSVTSFRPDDVTLSNRDLSSDLQTLSQSREHFYPLYLGMDHGSWYMYIIEFYLASGFTFSLLIF